MTASNVPKPAKSYHAARGWCSALTFGNFLANTPVPADHGDWNISALTCDGSGLTGNRPGCWQLDGRDGRGPVTGEFRLSFRESEWTEWLPHNSEAGEVVACEKINAYIAPTTQSRRTNENKVTNIRR